MDIKILIHWDADGICSGVLLREYLEENGIKVKKFLVPPLGLFDIDEEIEKELNKDTILFVCDINFSREIFERLKKKAGFIINFDHHLKKENIKGIIDFRKCLPSTTSVLKDFLGLKENFLVKAGVYGDSPVMKGKIKDFSNLLDTGYKLNSRNMVLRTVNFLWKNRNNPDVVFKAKFLKEAKSKLILEVKRIKRLNFILDNGIYIKKFSSKYNLISEIGRFYASLKKYDAVLLVNTGYIKNKWQFYTRNSKENFNIGKIIDFARKKGYNCGGKDTVMGAIIPYKNGEKFLEETLERLKG